MRLPVSLPATALGFLTSTVAFPYGNVEAVLRREPETNQQKADAVKEAFQHAWDGYVKYAFPHDELTPVSNGHADSR